MTNMSNNSRNSWSTEVYTFEPKILSKSIAYALVYGAGFPLIFSPAAMAQTLDLNLKPALNARNKKNLNEFSDRIRKVVVNQQTGDVDWDALQNEQYKLIEQGRQVIKPWEPELQIGLNYWYMDSWESHSNPKKPYVNVHFPPTFGGDVPIGGTPSVTPPQPNWPHDSTIESRVDIPSVISKTIDINSNSRTNNGVDLGVLKPITPPAALTTELTDAAQIKPGLELPEPDKPLVTKSLFTPLAPQVSAPAIASPKILSFQTFADCNFCTSSFTQSGYGQNIVAVDENGAAREPYTDENYHRFHSTWVSSGYEFEALVFKGNYISQSRSEPASYESNANRSKIVRLDSFNPNNPSKYSTSNKGIVDFNRAMMPDSAVEVENMSLEGKARNRQYFLVGGSRAFEGDQNVSVTFPKGHTIQLAGPLTFGITQQDLSDNTKITKNVGTITDSDENTRDFIKNMPVDAEGYLQNKAWVRNDKGELEEKLITGTGDNDGKSVLLGPRLPSSVATTTGSSSSKDNKWKVFAEGQKFIEYRIQRSKDGYVGYKIGISRVEEDDNRVATISNQGTIDFRGANSIGVYGYTPYKIVVDPTKYGFLLNENTSTERGKILLSGADSFGMKWSLVMGTSHNASPKYVGFENQGDIILRRNPDGEDRADGSVGMAVAVDSSLSPGRFVSINYDAAKNTKTGVIKLQDNIQGALGAYIDVASNFTNEGLIEVSAIAKPSAAQQEPAYNVALYAKQVQSDNKGTLPSVYQQSKKYQTGLINAAGAQIVLSGDYAAGMLASGKESGVFNDLKEQHAIAENMGSITSGTGRTVVKNIAMLADKQAEIVNRGQIEFNEARRSIGMMITKGAKGSLLDRGSVIVKGPSTGASSPVGVLNQGGDFKMGRSAAATSDRPTLSVSGSGGIALYASNDDSGNPSTTTINAGTIKATNNAISVYADDTKISFQPTKAGDVHLMAENNSLLFFQHGNLGKFDIHNYDITAEVGAKSSAFYLKETSLSEGQAADIGQALNKLFAGSTKDLNVSLKDKSVAFALDKPTATLKLSKVQGQASGNSFQYGDHVKFTPEAGADYQLFSLYRGQFSIDQDVDLDNSDDPYFKTTVIASSQTIEKDKTIHGSGAGLIALDDANYKETDEVGGLDDLVLTNHGTISLSGDSTQNKSTIGIVGGYGTIRNSATGKIEITGKDAFAIVGYGGSKINNEGEIVIDNGSSGIYAASEIVNDFNLGTLSIDVEHTGKITSLNNKGGVYGIWTDYQPNLKPNPNGMAANSAKVLNRGSIDFSNTNKSVAVHLSQGVNYVAEDKAKIVLADDSIAIRSLGGDLKDVGSTISLAKNSVAYQLHGDFKDATLDIKPVIRLGDASANNIIYDIRGVDLNQSNQANLSVKAVQQSKPASNSFVLLSLSKDGAKHTVSDAVTLENVQNGVFASLQDQTELTLKEQVTINGKHNAGVILRGDNTAHLKMEGAAQLNVKGEDAVALYLDGFVAPYQVDSSLVLNVDGGGVGGAAIYTDKADGKTLASAATLSVTNKATGIFADNLDSLTNTGKITVGEDSHGIQSTGSKAVTNNAAIRLNGKNAVAMHIRHADSLSNQVDGHISTDGVQGGMAIFAEQVSEIEQLANITLSGEKLTGIYAIGDPASATDKLINRGAMTLSSKATNSSQANAIVTEGVAEITNHGEITVSNAAQAVAMQTQQFGRTINSGVFNVQGDLAVGVFADRGLTLDNTAKITATGKAQAIALSLNDVKTVTNSAELVLQGQRLVGIAHHQGETLNNNGAIHLTGTADSAGAAITATAVNNVQNGGELSVDVTKNGMGLRLQDVETAHNTANILVKGKDSTLLWVQNTGSLTNAPSDDIQLSEEGAIAIYGQNLSQLDNQANIHVAHANAIGLVGDLTKAASTNSTWLNQGALNVQAAGGVGAYLSGDDESQVTQKHHFIQRGQISVADTSDKALPTIGILADRNYHHVTLDGVMQVGREAMGLVVHDVESTAASSSTVAAGGIAAVSQGDVKLQGAFNLAASDAKRPTIALLHQGSKQRISVQPSSVTMGAHAVAFSLNGSDNTVNVGVDSVVNLDNNNIFLHSADTKGTVTSSATVSTKAQADRGVNSLGKNIAYHVAGNFTNNGLIDMGNSWENIGIASVYKDGQGIATNAGTIKVGRSYVGAGGWDSPELRISAGMVAGGTSGYKGRIVNTGTIDLHHPYSIGMVAKGAGAEAINEGTIHLHSTANHAVGMLITDGASGVNAATGTITIDAKDAIGVFSTLGSTFKNYGKVTITAGADGSLDIVENATKAKGSLTTDGQPSYRSSDAVLQKALNLSLADLAPTDINVRPDAWADRIKKVAEINDHISAVELINQDEIAERLHAAGINKPAAHRHPDLSMYVDTSGKYFTQAINNLHLIQAAKPVHIDLVMGPEASVHSNAKALRIGETILEPFNKMVQDSKSIEKLNITSGSLTWVAVPEKLRKDGGGVESVLMVKIPYTRLIAADDRNYQFMVGLEDRYSKAALGSKEKDMFNSLNQIGVGGEAVFQNAVDELVAYQYANTNRRVASTKDLFDREFKMIRDWDTNTKDTAKMKFFGERQRYKTDRAGFYSYDKNSIGFMYVHQKETVKLGDAQGMFFGVAADEFKLKDSGGSKERAIALQAGYYWDKAYGDNRDEVLSLRTGGEFSNREMKRRFNVVDKGYQNEADYNTVGAFADISYAWNKRLSPSVLVSPSVGMDVGARYIEGFTESGEVLPVKFKGGMYYTVKPKIGAALEHQVELDKGRWVNNLDVTVAYDFAQHINKSSARVANSVGSYYDYRKDTQGAFGVDVLAKTRIEKEHWGVGAFAGAKIGSKQWVAGLEAKIKFW
ncbi:hypothetical protein RP300_02248 [Oligella urethralis]|uniref:autotransporter domain-containing protein n=1 Tax=Oligella urethralis TaxID=90245 RepID=UPI002958AE5C|nr:autotransporter domain-containing protein [Oligella urethralis]WOS38671.1 hypothetical protein RP300_02248 [Oligella urethralis]